MSNQILVADRLAVPDDVDTLSDLFADRGWSDGLPIVPPTEQRVRDMLAWTDRDAQDLVAEVPPAWGQATVELIAINGVMAGCRPEHMPVLVAAVAAMANPDLNIYSVQATTHACGLMLLLNGPIAKELKVNSWHGAFGPGNVANAAIGRAIRLILMNIGGAWPGTTDKSTQGQPCKYSYCFAENEDENPWEAYHVERGFAASTSTVTLVGAESPHNINDHVSTTARGVLLVAADTMGVMGNNNAYIPADVFVAFGPEHAAIIAGDGMRKRDVQRFLFEHGRVLFGHWRRGGMAWMFEDHQPFRDYSDDDLVPIVAKAEDIHILVVGGAGKHSSFIPTFGHTRSVTHPIALRDGRPASSIQDFRRR